MIPLAFRRARGLCVALLLTSLIPCAPAQQAGLSAARRAESAGDWKSVEDLSRTFLRRNPSSEEAALLHARALIHLGQPFDATLELEDYLKRTPDSVKISKLYAALLIEVVDQSSKAEEVLLRCTKLAPGDAEVWETLGRLHLIRHRGAEAVRALREAVRLAPGNPAYRAEFARALEDEGQAAEAGAAFRKALALNASSAKPSAIAYRLYAESLARKQRQKDSIEFFTKALLLNPHDSDAYHGRALAYESQEDLKRAEADAAAALRELPTRRDSHQLLIRIYRATGRDDKLARQVERMQSVVDEQQNELARGREMRAALNKAEPLIAQGKYAEALPLYEQVVAASPDFYEAHFALGICYQQTGQPAKGEASLRKYLTFQPLSADGHAALGLLLAAVRRPAEAKPELERALELNPSLVEPRNALAELSMRELVRAGDRTAALRKCEEGLAANPGDAMLEELHASLLVECAREDACKARAIQALQQRPSSAPYLRAVTLMLVDQKPLEPVTKEMVKRMMQALPADPEAAFVRAKWLHATNQLDAALAESRTLSTRNGATSAQRARALTLQAVTLDRLERSAEAEAAFRGALELNRTLDFPDPRMEIPYVDHLLTQAREADARTLLDEVLRWAPAFAPARLRRAVAYSNAGDHEQALMDAQVVVDQPGEDPTVLRAAHALLAKTYTVLGREKDAKRHQDWILNH
jgi:tetratricopeptide (TPR) repeat protein